MSVEEVERMTDWELAGWFAYFKIKKMRDPSP